MRRRLVTSETTLLGLLKHVTYVEGEWFDQAVTGRSSRPDRSRKHARPVLHADPFGLHRLDPHRRTSRDAQRRAGRWRT